MRKLSYKLTKFLGGVWWSGFNKMLKRLAKGNRYRQVQSYGTTFVRTNFPICRNENARHIYSLALLSEAMLFMPLCAEHIRRAGVCPKIAVGSAARFSD